MIKANRINCNFSLIFFFKFKNLKNNLKLKFEIKEHSINGYLIFYSLNN